MNLRSFACLSFDCYGTLIDWETGLVEALRPVLDSHGVNVDTTRLLEAYARAEAAAEAGPFRPYREILREAVRGLGQALGFCPTATEEEAFSVSVQHPPAFSDSVEALRALKARYRLIVLSNIDDDLFAHSQRRLGVEFDEVFTAQRIGAYKPSEQNFRCSGPAPGHFDGLGQSPRGPTRVRGHAGRRSQGRARGPELDCASRITARPMISTPLGKGPTRRTINNA